MDWEPLDTFDYAAESQRVGSMFVPAWVTDGKRVDFATHWGHDGDAAGWYDEVDQSYDGPRALPYEPTHWMPKPAPPAT